MRRRWLCLVVWLSIALSGQLSSSYGQEKPQPGPLTDEEKREILDRLVELRIARAELQILHEHLDAKDQLDAREKAAWERTLELEKRATALAERERDLEKQRADFLETALKQVTKGRSKLCTAKKFLSIGIWRCN